MINLDPMAAFTHEEYKRWNLDITTDNVTRLFGGTSEEYES